MKVEFIKKVQFEIGRYSPIEYFGSEKIEIEQESKRYPKCNELLRNANGLVIKQLEKEKDYWIKNIHKAKTAVDPNKKGFKPSEEDIVMSAHRKFLKAFPQFLAMNQAPLQMRPENIPLQPMHGFELSTEVYLGYTGQTHGKYVKDTFTAKTLGEIQIEIAKHKAKGLWKFMWEDYLILSDLKELNIFFENSNVCWTELMDLTPVVDIKQVIFSNPTIVDTLGIKMNEEIQDPLFAYQTILRVTLQDQDEIMHQYIYQGMDMMEGVVDGEYRTDSAVIYPPQKLLTIYELTPRNANIHDKNEEKPLVFLNVVTNIGRFYVGSNDVYMLGRSFARKY